MVHVWKRALAGSFVLGTATLGFVACTVGQGTGDVSGDLTIPDCDKNLSSYDMHANFFAADAANASVSIRIQNGGGVQEYADSLTIIVDDFNTVEAAIERTAAIGSQPPSFDIQLERPPGSAVDVPAPLVRMSLSLRGTCGNPIFGPGDPSDLVLDAVGGQITFSAILHGDLDSRDTNSKRIEGSFTDVPFQDPRDPTGPLTGTVSGTFKFFFQRGGPAQPFS